MKRLAFLLTAILVMTSVVPAPPVVAQNSETGVTGAGAGIFPGGATFNGIPLNGLNFGKGIFISGDGSATGEFQTTLLGTSLLGQPQNIAVEGKVSNGSVAYDGSVTFSGLSTVNMGDGTLPLTGVPFTVTATTGGLLLILNGTTLPTATVSAGSITIK